MTQHNFTTIDDLYNENDEGDNNSYEPYGSTVTPLSTLFASAEKKSVMRPPCEIRCTDILSHITMCPVCSKLYKEVDKNHHHSHGEHPHPHPHHPHPHHPPPRREHFVTAPSAMADNCSKLKIAVIVLGALLLIILLLWWRSKYVSKEGGSNVVPSSAFAPYMNRR